MSNRAEPNVLIVDDSIIISEIIKNQMIEWGFEPICCMDGEEAWEVLQQPNSPRLALVDWMMPRLNGIELCQLIRNLPRSQYIYTIMLTTRSDKHDVQQAFEAGVDDYIVKPFEEMELHSRIRAGTRILRLQQEIGRLTELTEAQRQIEELHDLLPMCMHCRKVRDEKQVWQKLEAYLENHTNTKISHGLCEECLEKFHPSSDD